MLAALPESSVRPVPPPRQHLTVPASAGRAHAAFTSGGSVCRESPALLRGLETRGGAGWAAVSLPPVSHLLWDFCAAQVLCVWWGGVGTGLVDIVWVGAVIEHVGWEGGQREWT